MKETRLDKVLRELSNELTGDQVKELAFFEMVLLEAGQVDDLFDEYPGINLPQWAIDTAIEARLGQLS